MAQHQTLKTIQTAQTPLLQGAIAGFIATVPMTVFMLTTQRFLPKGQRYDLPPEIITKQLAARADIRQHMNKSQILAATTAAHFAYGTAMGLLYGPVNKRLPQPGVVKGILFGVAIWAVSYLGLLPLMGILASAGNEPFRRNLMMIAAHIVWGSSMGLLADVLER